MEVSAPDSTDTEMYQVTEQSLLITSDRQALKEMNVAKLQEQAEEQARHNVQSQFYEVVNQDTRWVHLKREGEDMQVEVKCRLPPQDHPHQEEKGCSILKKRMANTKQPTPRPPCEEETLPSGISNPLMKLPGNLAPQAMGDQTHKQQAFQARLNQCYMELSRSKSRK